MIYDFEETDQSEEILLFTESEAGLEPRSANCLVKVYSALSD